MTTYAPIVITDCDHSNTRAEADVFEDAGLAWRLEN